MMIEVLIVYVSRDPNNAEESVDVWHQGNLNPVTVTELRAIIGSDSGSRHEWSYQEIQSLAARGWVLGPVIADQYLVEDQEQHLIQSRWFFNRIS